MNHDKLMSDAEKQVGCGWWTSVKDIGDELKTNPEWLSAYGLEEIMLRDIVIAKLLGESQ